MIISECYVNSWYGWFSWQGWFKWHSAKKTKGTDLISLRTHKMHTPSPTFYTRKLWQAVFANGCYSERHDQPRVWRLRTPSFLLEKQSVYKLTNRTLKKGHKGTHVLRLECRYSQWKLALFIHLSIKSSVWKSQKSWFLAYQKYKTPWRFPFQRSHHLSGMTQSTPNGSLGIWNSLVLETGNSPLLGLGKGLRRQQSGEQSWLCFSASYQSWGQKRPRVKGHEHNHVDLNWVSKKVPHLIFLGRKVFTTNF